MRKISLLILAAMLLGILAGCNTPAPVSEPPAATEAPAEATQAPDPTAVATEAPAEEPAAAPVEPVGFSELSIDAADYSYSVLDQVSEGWVRVTLTNSGTEPHHVQFLRLNDGISSDQFLAALAQDVGPALALVQEKGGVGAIAPMGSAEAILNLTAGEYVILCFIPSPSDGMPHLAKGMVKTLSVATAAGATAAEPTADLVVTLKDFAFDLPDVLPTGKTVIKIENEGPESHEMNFLKLADGKTVEDVTQFFAAPNGPPPFTPVGGINGLSVGLTGYLEVELPAGEYVAICNIHSPVAAGAPHHSLGMIKGFTVGAESAGSAAETSFVYGKFVSVNDAALSYQFNEDGTYAFFVGSDAVLEGTFRIDGDLFIELSNNDTASAQFCTDAPPYRWSFDGEKLTFEATADDPCKGRREANADTYTLVP